MSAPSNRPPEIPGYTLLEKIGEGGKGEVYRARQESGDETVAIKFLHPIPSPQLAADFQREADLMGSLSHPNVVAIYNCGKAEDRFYLVMEYVAGSSLRALMKPGEAWPVAKALPILGKIADALTYMHSRDILHLDLKPENVICGNRAVKITDFGLALSRVDAWTLSELGLVQVSLDYCSPEQRYGLPVDQRSDLFSMATICYELLTGQLPARVYIPVTQRNPSLPASMDAIMRRGLARDPDERYPVVELFRGDLMEALCGPST
jgi:serine/threonine-protein kinase